MIETTGERFRPAAARYLAERHPSGWRVVDAATRLVVSQFATGSAGALEAQAAAASLNARSGPPAELRSWRKAHGLTLKSLASALGVTWLTVQRWETGARGIPPFLYLALERLEQKAAELS